MSPKPQYAPEVFRLPSAELAKKVILTPEAGLSPEQRWEKETPWLRQRMPFDHQRLIIDYGCGIGRLAKLYAQPVIGVDISDTMRAQAEAYVGRPSFCAVHPPMFNVLIREGLRAHGALCVWTLQHILNPQEDVSLLAAVLHPGTHLYIVNRNHRAIPSRTGDSFNWVSDGIDVFSLLSGWFEKEWEEQMPLELCKPGASISCWVRTLSVLNFGTAAEA